MSKARTLEAKSNQDSQGQGYNVLSSRRRPVLVSISSLISLVPPTYQTCLKIKINCSCSMEQSSCISSRAFVQLFSYNIFSWCVLQEAQNLSFTLALFSLCQLNIVLEIMKCIKNQVPRTVLVWTYHWSPHFYLIVLMLENKQALRCSTFTGTWNQPLNLILILTLSSYITS